jgi:sulfite reductase (NADPH) flavoprotein alpha-component
MDKDEFLEFLQNQEESPVLPKGLPISGKQKHWIGGLLSGLQIQVATMGGTSNDAGKPITIVYGTQTGNSEAMAEEAAAAAKKYGMAPKVMDMGDIELSEFAKTERILVVTSTYGEGEMPDNAQIIWEEISANDAPKFENTFFSVLALGDTSYDQFCEAGILWDTRLAALGATRVTERVDCDVDYEEPAMAWIEKVMPIITEKGSQETVSVEGAKAKATKPKFDKKNPLEAELLTKKVLSGEKSSKEIVHFEFSLGDSGETYLAGDALNIIPENRPDLIQEILDLFEIQPGEEIMKRLRYELEIRTPSKELVELVGNKTEDQEMRRMVENNDKVAIEDFMWGLDSYQLIKSYGTGNITFYDFLNTCKSLSPRAYSISSSIKKHDNEVHLTIGSVRYKREDRQQNGVVSTFLADFAKVGDKVKCYFSPNKQFKIPEDGNNPIIMVGPGTGIAPFRAFLEEREADGAKGDNWLLFGDRNKEHDFIYQEEIEEMQKSGLITKLDLAFSRDQDEKIYVQDKMRESGAEMFAWLERGGYFYICGDAYRMAKDVDIALHQLIEKHGNMSEEESVSYVNKLKKEKRYVRDVY